MTETNCTPEPYFIWYKDKDFKNPLKTCDAPAQSTRQNLDTQKRSFCELTLAAIPGDKLTCLKTNSLGQKKQTFEIKPKILKNQGTKTCRKTTIGVLKYNTNNEFINSLVTKGCPHIKAMSHEAIFSRNLQRKFG